MAQSTIIHDWFSLVLNRRHAVICINDGLVYWQKYVSLGFNELINNTQTLGQEWGKIMCFRTNILPATNKVCHIFDISAVNLRLEKLSSEIATVVYVVISTSDYADHAVRKLTRKGRARNASNGKWSLLSSHQSSWNVIISMNSHLWIIQIKHDLQHEAPTKCLIFCKFWRASPEWKCWKLE